MKSLICLAVAISFIVLCGSLPFLTGITFQQRCERAGFAGADHERCIMRLEAGKPMYPENEAYRP